jgi:phasin family protein
MTLTAEQILASHKANIETLFGLTTKAFEGVEKLVELNVTASRAALTEAASHTQAVLGVKDAQELLALQASLFQPLAEKTAAYSRHLYDIASGTGAEFGKAFEAKTADAQKAFTNLVDSAAKNAPAGSETAVAVMKSAVSAANNAFESVQKAVKQASDVAEANFNAVPTPPCQRSQDSCRVRTTQALSTPRNRPSAGFTPVVSLDPLETRVSRIHFKPGSQCWQHQHTHLIAINDCLQLPGVHTKCSRVQLGSQNHLHQQIHHKAEYLCRQQQQIAGKGALPAATRLAHCLGREQQRQEDRQSIGISTWISVQRDLGLATSSLRHHHLDGGIDLNAAGASVDGSYPHGCCLLKRHMRQHSHGVRRPRADLGPKKGQPYDQGKR